MRTNLARQYSNRDDFDQARITAINRLTGRVSLAMRNGLISTGTYLYNLSDLRVGMDVLVGIVDGSYAILNKIQNIPRQGVSYSMSSTYVYVYIDNVLTLVAFSGISVESEVIGFTILEEIPLTLFDFASISVELETISVILLSEIPLTIFDFASISVELETVNITMLEEKTLPIMNDVSIRVAERSYDFPIEPNVIFNEFRMLDFINVQAEIMWEQKEVVENTPMPREVRATEKGSTIFNRFEHLNFSLDEGMWKTGDFEMPDELQFMGDEVPHDKILVDFSIDDEIFTE